MKTIGIITFHTADNYGAVLQAYALQEYLNSDSQYSAQIINFCTDVHTSEYPILPRLRGNICRWLVLYTFHLCEKKQLSRKKQGFHSFRQNHLKLTERYSEPNAFCQNPPKFDVYISGSDQVFHPNVRYSNVYYLGFNKNNSKKIAYAPSLGITRLSADDEIRISGYLKDFDSLSCRESQGASILRRLSGINVPTVVDPVFLLTRNQWEVIAIAPQSRTPYIFVYDLCGGSRLQKIAKRVQIETGLRIVTVSASVKKDYPLYQAIYDCSPEELLGYIKNASYVVTDSFHGTALSIRFGTKVITYIAQPTLSSRIVSLIDSLGLSEQIVSNIDSFDFKRMKFNEYNDKLEELISASKDYLKIALS